MAWLEFGAHVVIHVPPDRVFDYFADHRHVAEVLEGISRWEPAGGRSRGVGARFEVEMQALGVPLKSVLRLDRWRRPREIGWVSESGLIKQEGGFTFTETERGTRVDLRIAYSPPGFAVGAAIAQRLDGVVRGRLDRALRRIKQTLEA